VEAQAALQAQRARASKLESLGTLAGGVAHDFNNILAAIIGFGEMAEDKAPPDSAQARHIGKVLQAAQRGKALVERILAFSRGAPRESLVFELAPLAEEALDMLAQSLRPGLVLVREFKAPGGCVKGDPAQAFEAVMNLCTNAMQAMPGEGTLSLQLERRRVAAARTVSHGLLAPGSYLELSVRDQGMGIAPEVMEHLFEPFFTTRRAQAGTGLGLAVVHSVLGDMGGAVDVSSRPGQGSCFRLYFPESKETASKLLADPGPPPLGAGQRLMVVDDQAELVAMGVEMLEGLGYRPSGYTDPQQARADFEADPTAFAALITDEMMPGLSGTALAGALRASAPQLPVLLVSGYGGARLASRAAEAGVFRVLGKPLQRAVLARALAEALAGRQR
jgi:nitrogen-specific signal transduction histidine kinase/CheY-like chemotaxis protein